MFPNKQTTRDAAYKKYGAIDLTSRQWPGQSVWLKLLELSPVIAAKFPNWKVLQSDVPVTHIAANRDMHLPLISALSCVANAGLGELLKTFDGCFNIRLVREGKDVSAHSYGLAIDLNAADNKLGQTSGGFFDQPELVKCFTDQGFDWGGDFHDRKDPMHFSYCWELSRATVVILP